MKPMDPVNHIEFEVNPAGGAPILRKPTVVVVNGTNIYNPTEVHVEQVPEQTIGTCKVTLVFEAVTGIYSAQQEPRVVEQPADEVSHKRPYISGEQLNQLRAIAAKYDPNPRRG